MLFNSYEFIFAFLPMALVLYYGLKRYHAHELALAALVLASLAFYSYWNPVYLPLLAASVLCNYFAGRHLAVAAEGPRKRLFLALGVTANLALIAYYKYADFFVGNINVAAGVQWALPGLVLPLAISFFTFQQIAFLVDSSRGRIKDLQFVHYALFVTFFPQLIAGPIVHHQEVLPQFASKAREGFRFPNLVIGATIFSIGLFKKAVIADGVAGYSTPLFDAAATGYAPHLLEAWCSTLAYTFQLYFDFSGYSDMAIGASRMFGIILPMNFNSPYKASSIIEFWQCWHVTLSRFLRDYLYIPLGGNRKGTTRRYVNLMITMLLGGLWHGAGWSFVFWGGLHGAYLSINHLWRALRRTEAASSRPHGRATAAKLVSRTLTFLAVVVAWVFFRAENLDTAARVLRGMAGLNGGALAGLEFFWGAPQVAALLLSWVVAWTFPSTQQFMARYQPVLEWGKVDRTMSPFKRFEWRPTPAFAIAIALIAATAIALTSEESEFLYFQF